VNGIVSRMYSQISDFQNRKEEAVKEFELVVNGLTAFFILWRSSHQGTSGIDHKHRDIFISEAVPGIRNFYGSDFLTAKKVLGHYRTVLESENLTDLPTWIGKLKDNQTYAESKPMTRLMLLLSMDKTIPDTENPGLLKESRQSLTSPLNLNYYNYLKTIEHIAPQTPSGDWDRSIYENDRLIHTIGNLTILPSQENASFSNKSWRVKAMLFQVLAETDPARQSELKAQAIAEGLSESVFPVDSFDTRPTLPFAAALTNQEIHWNRELINKRTENLGTIIFKRCKEWLST